ncbi:uncharacterized protein LTR77_001006 [Saxophila tyrrhenica]|uniref:SET domain-containing protein n=1 Tax=Saxophila tyrrhenica TaxID=1690608 RepID=A0AAV9PQ34_9PEZI|nr:hypothetical protein LTR77_001006 [Saxophila tyrrhenica]
MNANFTVQNLPGKRKALVAARPITLGEEIVSESPLGTVGPMLKSTFNEDAFFDLKHEYSGVEVISAVYRRMSPSQQTQFVQLHTTGHIVDTFVLNAFSDYSYLAGLEYVTLRVYNNICRANNSCRPNAMYSYNPNTQRGALRAIRRIDYGEEVTVEYQMIEDMSLQRLTSRNNFFQKNCGFSYDCPACRGPDRGRDSEQRARAGRLLETIINDRHSIPASGDSEARRTQRLERLDRYIDILRGLQISDGKMADALKHRAEVHRQGYQLAQRDGNDHFPSCRRDGTPLHHLASAKSDLLDAHMLKTICYGPAHPECDQVRSMIAEIMRLTVILQG